MSVYYICQLWVVGGFQSPVALSWQVLLDLPELLIPPPWVTLPLFQTSYRGNPPASCWPGIHGWHPYSAACSWVDLPGWHLCCCSMSNKLWEGFCYQFALLGVLISSNFTWFLLLRPLPHLLCCTSSWTLYKLSVTHSLADCPSGSDWWLSRIPWILTLLCFPWTLSLPAPSDQ